MPKRIVYTRPDNSVAVCAPSLTALRYMTHGGGRWDGYPRGFLARQIAKQAEEAGERAAHRFVMAMQFGGCTDAEAYEIMRDRFCTPHGTACELWDTADVPTDRTYRDAWVRSHNGGPIRLDEKKVWAMQERMAWKLYEKSGVALPVISLALSPRGRIAGAGAVITRKTMVRRTAIDE